MRLRTFRGFPGNLQVTVEVRDYDWSQEIAALKMPVLLVFADAGSVHPSHIAELYGTHCDLYMSPLLATVASAFLDAGGTR